MRVTFLTLFTCWGCSLWVFSKACSLWSIKCVPVVAQSWVEARVWTYQQHLTVEGAGEAQADLGTKELLLWAVTKLCSVEARQSPHLFVSGIWSQLFGNIWKLFKLAVWAIRETDAYSWAGFCRWCLSEWRVQLACLGSEEHILTQM